MVVLKFSLLLFFPHPFPCRSIYQFQLIYQSCPYFTAREISLWLPSTILNRRLFRLEMDAMEKKKPQHLPEIEFRSRCDQSHCVVTVLTELSPVLRLRKLRYANQSRDPGASDNGRSNVLTARRISAPSGERVSWFVVLFCFSRLQSMAVHQIARTTVYIYTIFIHLQFHSPLYNLNCLNLWIKVDQLDDTCFII